LQTTELAEIDASLQAIVRRAYELGRSDALKKVVSVLNEDRPCDERLALMAPDEMMHPSDQQQSSNGMETATSAPPWWAWRVR
jgi:ferritin-like metal-binding protein YciE